MSNSQRPHGLQPTGLLRPWDFPGKSTGVGCHHLLRLSHCSCVQLFATPWTVAYQVPPSMGFSRQEYWSGLPLAIYYIFYSMCVLVTQSSPTLCDPMNCSMPGLPVHHQLPEFTQTHVHRVDDAIQPSHPPSSPSPPAFNISQHQSLFK